MVLFKDFHDPVRAQIIKEKLESNGIHCFLGNEHGSTIMPHLNFAHGGIQLMIQEEDLDKANRIFNEEDAAEG